MSTEESVSDDLKPGDLCVDKDDIMVATQIRMALEAEGVDAIVTGLQFNDVAGVVNRHRPEVPIFVAANTEREWNQLVIRWGVTSFLLKKARSSDAFEKAARAELAEKRLVKKDDLLLFLTSVKEK